MSLDDFSAVMPTANQKAPVRPRFFVDAIRSKAKSDLTKRSVYDDVEMVEIIVPGDNRSIVCERVKDEHRYRWPDAYRAFKEGREAPLEGTPCSEWAYLSPAQIATFAAANIKTVEDIANCSDANLPALGSTGARDLRERAKHFLKATEGAAPLAELQSRVNALEAQAVVDRQTIGDLNAALARASAKETEHVGE